jgi:protein TonB
MKDLKLSYGIYLRMGFLSAIIIFILLFCFIPYAAPQPYELKREIITMVEEISAQIEKYETPPPEERPKIAIEAESDITDEAVETIAETVFRENLIGERPVGPEIEIVPYYKVEVKPKPVNIPKAVYPELALKAGIEGTAVIKALVDVDGSIREVQILKSSGNPMLDEAALRAARLAQFTPARQRDQVVRVWVSIPVAFRLKG